MPQEAAESIEMDVARQAAVAGGEVVSRYFREGVQMRAKAPQDLVSDADLESEAAIAAIISSHFPDHAILGEESHKADLNAEHLWIVDPLDGTTNFAHQLPHFSISICYCRGGQAQCGVIFNPIRDDWYTAERGSGAWCNGHAAHVGAQSELSEVLVGVGFYYDRGAMMESTLRAMHTLFGHGIHGIRRFGTASLDLCQVGLGMYGGYFEYELSPWDFAAGKLFVEEAGGQVTTCSGDALPYQRTSVLASNRLLHDKLLKVTVEHLPGQ